MTKFDTTTKTRVAYTFFLRSKTLAPFLGITTEVYKGWDCVYYESHIIEADSNRSLRESWMKWRDFLTKGEPTKVTSGYAYGKYITAAKEWEA